MSMLKSFFEIGTDKSLFDGLYISGNKELCDEHMGKYPVIFLSFKGVDGLDFTTARRMPVSYTHLRKDIEKEFKEVIGDRIASICSSHNVTVDYAFQDIKDVYKRQHLYRKC